MATRSGSSDDSSSDDPSLRHGTARRTEEEDEDAVRSALHFAVGRICREEEAGPDGARMSSEAIGALTELTYQYATTSLANDLVCFSRHANRRTINVDDVKLVLRKDPDGLLSSLEKFCENNDLGISGAGTKVKRASVGKSKTGEKRDSGPILQAFQKKGKSGAKEKSSRERWREELEKHMDESSSSSNGLGSVDESDSSEVEIAFEASRRKERDEVRKKVDDNKENTGDVIHFGSDSENEMVVDKETPQREERRLNLNDTASSDESNEEPIVRRLRYGPGAKKVATEKPIDLTEDD